MLNKLVFLDDDEDWEDNAAGRILLFLVGALLIRAGFRIWVSVDPGSLFGAFAILALYGTAIQLMIFSVTTIPMEEYGRWVAYAVLFVLLVATMAAALRGLTSKLGTDAMMFSAYSTDLILQGRNPYTTSMAGALRQAGVDLRFTTPRIDGSNVLALSYPAGSVLAYLPQRVTIGRTAFGLRLTNMVVVVLIGVVITKAMPAELALAGPASLLAARNWFVTAAGGLIDMLWVLPVILSMVYWARKQWLIAAFWFGLAAGTKQLPWAIGPFLAIWLWVESPTWSVFKHRTIDCLSGGFAGFLLLNLPFILWNPVAWIEGVLTPVAGGAPMVHQGIGLTQLAVLGLYPLSTSWHTLAVAVVTISLLVGYALYFDRVKWAAWLLPMAIYFVHYRSLNSYFVSFVPIAAVAVMAAWGELHWPRRTAVDSTDPSVQPEVSD